ncbi:YHS domain-containing (seleno)protein [soil metagenome]
MIAALAGLFAATYAVASERLVVDRFTGLAIGGFDPVAFFTDARPISGEPDFELMQGGAVWRFSNQGNRAAFVAHPEVYGPQFGGYDPVDVARGVAYPGNPMFWLISDSRLYLFGRTESRDAFAAGPAAVLREARKRWPQLQSE